MILWKGLSNADKLALCTVPIHLFSFRFNQWQHRAKFVWLHEFDKTLSSIWIVFKLRRTWTQVSCSHCFLNWVNRALRSEWDPIWTYLINCLGSYIIQMVFFFLFFIFLTKQQQQKRAEPHSCFDTVIISSYPMQPGTLSVTLTHRLILCEVSSQLWDAGNFQSSHIPPNCRQV